MDKYIFQIDDGSTTERHAFIKRGADLSAWYITSSASGTGDANVFDATNPWLDGETKKVAMAYRTNDVILVEEGVVSDTDSTVDLPTGITTINLGQRDSGVTQLNGHVKNIKYYNRRMPDSWVSDRTT